MYKCVVTRAEFWGVLRYLRSFIAYYLYAKKLNFCGHSSQFFFETLAVGIFFSVHMNCIDCLSSLHWRFFSSCFSTKSIVLTRISRSLQASPLVAIRSLYFACISFSSKLSGGTDRSRSSISCFANSHLLFFIIRSRLHCALISLSFGGVNTVTVPPC